METTPAILLRRTRFSETSLILTWLTRDLGKLKTMARGALRPKSSFAGMLDLFFEVEIGLLRSQRSEIHALREAALLTPHDGLRRDYRRVELAAYFAALLDAMIEPEHPTPELFALLQRALAWLEKESPTRRAMLHFENELARLSGLFFEESAYHSLRESLPFPKSRAALLEQLP
ncbi:MAG TPA: DNA repair protein RecO [Chthoniobacteraceae bacterium]|nr:DNA repair protein RecO [Chthoniobacteraceae bacterium]